MSIWSAEIKELEKLFESLKGQLPDLEKELGKLIKADDENMVLLYSRRCLEVIITDLCECELKRPRKTEPLKGIIDKLHKEEKVPSNIITSMDHLNSLSAYGAHPKDFDPEQVKPVLVNLNVIIKWYLKYKNIVAISKTEGEGEQGQLRDELFKEEEIEVRKEMQEKPAKAGERKLISMVTIVALLIIAAILAYPKIFKKNTLEKLRSTGERISVAVMPFQNMTGEKQWDIWQEGIQEILTTILSNEEGLKVKPAEIIDKLVSNEGVIKYASLTPSIAGKISRKLTTNIFISGNILKADSILLLNIQLFNTRSQEVLKSFQRQGTKDKIISLIDSLSRMVKDFLIISKLKNNAYSDYQFYSSISSVNSIEAYKLMIEATKEVQKLNLPASVKLNYEALSIDSNYIPAKFSLVGNYIDQGLYEDAKKWCTKIYGQKDNLPLQQKLWITFQHAYLFETPYEQIKYLKQLLDFDNQNPETYLEIGWAYQKVLQYNNAISSYEKSIQIYNRMNLKPFWSANYTFLGELYHKTGRYKKEKKLYRKAEQDFPDRADVVFRQCVLALSQNKPKVANEYIDNYKSILKENSASEADISTNLGRVYNDAGINNNAENYLRQALALEPDKPDKLNNLGRFLIDKDQKINEGLTLIDRALEINPSNFDYLDTKGWGLYKQGKHKEALEILQKSWDLRREQAIYDHEAYLHLEAAKKAVARQKNN
jgi:tetratricopeptide (TPR) repeat protein